MPRSRLRRAADLFSNTPLHPQWLLSLANVRESRLDGVQGGTVLDIGCSDRWVERRLPAGCHYIGLDYPITGIAIYGARPDVFADARRLPLADGSIDFVVFLEVLEHLRNPREAMEEIARVLKPGGRVVLSMPFLYPIHDAPHDFQRYTVHGLIRETEIVGLRVDRVKNSLGSAETAGLIACLAIGGMAEEAIRRRSFAIVLVPVIAAVIPVINLLAWIAGRLLPSWAPITAGYELRASKP